MTLWHFTCGHGLAAIGSPGLVLPLRDHVPEAADRLPDDMRFMAHLAWFTDLGTPDRDALGLTSDTLACDRGAHRYRVTDAGPLVRWLDYWDRWPMGARLLNQTGAPGRWWVSTVAVPVVLDEHT